ncbi:MAG TPA: 23S rRNA (guanosine(2251)-2'-O)-methyltransferase RlmB [Thermodesulfobacteriota bacterium]|nr:23S rRNA (guanosine(2251)-2'-O)-methyltransferase RlmB [Thermodesulfobacteriota bacterium]
MEEKIFGINPVLEILKSTPERIQQVYLPVGDLKAKKALIYSLARQHNIKVNRIPHSRFPFFVGEGSHQGVIGIVSPYTYQPLESLLATWRRAKEKALFLILDGVEDPRNFGAMVRSAHTAGIHGVIVAKHRSAPVNEAAFKASAGAFAHTPVCRVTNIASTLETLKKEGIWIVGTEAQAKQSFFSFDFNLDVAIVIGGEGQGIHPLVKKHCDFLLSIPTRGKINSLNASVAAAVVLYEIIRQRHFA